MRHGRRSLLMGALVMAAAACEGPAGPEGPQGKEGPAGQAGATGVAGQAGPPGQQGPTGPTGQAGATGPAGGTGPVGQQGPTGPAGNAGDAGAGSEPGRNAYITADGLAVDITATTLDATGMTVTFNITDGNHTPLDVDGRFTRGAVAFGFALAWLDQDGSGQPLKYHSYTTTHLTSPITHVSGDLPWLDSGGTLTLLSWQAGTYSYKFGTAIPLAHLDRTHTVAITATRTLDGVDHVTNTPVSYTHLTLPTIYSV